MVEGGFEALAAGMGSAEFHVSGDYAFEVCLLCLEVCQSIASWSVYSNVYEREFRFTSSRPWTADHTFQEGQFEVDVVYPRHPKALDGLAVVSLRTTWLMSSLVVVAMEGSLLVYADVACGCLKEESLAKPSFLDLKQMMIYQSTVAAWRTVESFCIC
jgi:hypothetical protein